MPALLFSLKSVCYKFIFVVLKTTWSVYAKCCIFWLTDKSVVKDGWNEKQCCDLIFLCQVNIALDTIMAHGTPSLSLTISPHQNLVLRIIPKQEAMENFVFLDEIKTKLMKWVNWGTFFTFPKIMGKCGRLYIPSELRVPKSPFLFPSILISRGIG